MTTLELPRDGVFLNSYFDECSDLNPEDIAVTRLHIATSLPELICDPAQLAETDEYEFAIRLQHPFVVPSVEASAQELSNDPGAQEDAQSFSYAGQQFYWDTYFMGTKWLMLNGEEHRPLAAGMLQNMVDMFNKYGVIPNSSLLPRLGHSQPPFLSSYIFELYDTYHETNPEISQTWLTHYIDVAKREYRRVWMGRKFPHDRQVYRGLSRYYDIDLTDEHIQAESGHDYGPRFEGEAANFLPADLNALLYKYEMDFAREAGMRGDEAEMRHWLLAAEVRKRTMNELMYDKERGLFCDYNYKTGKRGKIASLASYAAMWAGMVEPGSEQAAEMVTALTLFEHVGGVAVTEWYDDAIVPSDTCWQWGKINSFSATTLMTTDGLEICGYPDVARRIALKSLAAKVRWFKQHGEILEAYNAVDPSQFPAPGVYPRQKGFGWTDAEIEYYCTKYIDGRHLPAAVMRGAVLLGAA